MLVGGVVPEGALGLVLARPGVRRPRTAYRRCGLDG
jgi:hypothetical protein